MNDELSTISARAAVLHILEEEGLPPGFPPEVEAEVEQIKQSPGLDDPSLLDLTALPFVTIDGPDSRDLDQALFLERDHDGVIVVRYAIADAAHFIRPGTALFSEALRRGASYYVPGRVVPMLPPALSEGLVSLNANSLRRAVVFTSRIDNDGRCISTTIERARIRSQAKLSFPQVQRFLEGHAAPALEGQPFTESLRLLPVVGHLRLRDQELRQVIRYRRIEVDFSLDDVHDALMAMVAPRGEVERYNEQLSLLCNSEGGRLLSSHTGPAVQGIYRAHPAPPASRLSELEALIDGLVELHGLDESWRWHRGGERGLSEYLGALPEDGPFARVAAAIQRQAVMTNLRSSYTEQPASHHGVGARPYARFSAPMREIVGVFVHKELMEKLGLQTPLPTTLDEDLRLRVMASAARSRELQSRLDARINRVVIDRLLSRDLAVPLGERPWRTATVMGLTAAKVHVQLDEPPLDLKLYRTDIERSWQTPLTPSDNLAALRDPAGRLALVVGGPVRLRVERFDADRDRWELTASPAQ